MHYRNVINLFNYNLLKLECMIQDLTHYGSSELTLWFNNDEGLYHIYQKALRRNDFEMLELEAKELFKYTPEQLEELREEFEADLLEDQD